MSKLFKLFIFSTMLATLLSAKELKGNYEFYYLTTDTESLFSKESSVGGFSVHLGYKHILSNNICLNISFTGYNDFGSNIGGSLEPFNFHGNSSFSSYFDILNITYNDQYFKYTLGRQLLHTPMLGSIDMYLTPSNFEAYTIESTLKNKEWSLFATYVDKVRPVASGSNFKKLSGNNYGVGIKYKLNDNKSNLWVYNIDSGNYTQLYLDHQVSFDNLTVNAQYIHTNYIQQENSNAYGVKFTFDKLPLVLNLSYNKVIKNKVGHLEIDSLYTSSWNTFSSDIIGESLKISAFKKFEKFSFFSSYSKYNNRNEFDLILDYDLSLDSSIKLVYTNTTYSKKISNINGIELNYNYNF